MHPGQGVDGDWVVAWMVIQRLLVHSYAHVEASLSKKQRPPKKAAKVLSSGYEYV